MQIRTILKNQPYEIEPHSKFRPYSLNAAHI